MSLILRNIFIVLLLTVSLISCKKDTADFTEPETKTGSPVELTIVLNRNVNNHAVELINAFNKKHEGKIKASFKLFTTKTDKTHDQLVSLLSSGSDEIDVITGDVIWTAEFAENGYCLNLDEYIKKDNIVLSNYFNGPVKSVTYKGSVWGLPFYTDVGVLYYRTDILNRAPATWEELYSMAESSKGKENTKYGYLLQGRRYEALQCNAVEFIYSYGGRVIDDAGNVVINSPQTIKALKMMKKITDSNFVPPEILDYAQEESVNSFISGEAVMVRNWPYLWSEGNIESKSVIAGKFEISPLPRGDEGNVGTLGGWNFMINKYSKHVDEAWELIKFLSGPEGEKIAALYAGFAPAYKPLYKDEEILAKNPHFKKESFLKSLTSSLPRPISPKYRQLTDIMQKEIHKALKGEQSIEDAVINMDKKLNVLVGK